MENGTDHSSASSGEEFVLRSGVRRGYKREFDFSVKAQAEITASIGHTRARKAPEVFDPRSSPPRRRRAVGMKPGVRPPKVPRFPRAPPSVVDPVASAPRMAEDVGNQENLGLEGFLSVPVAHAVPFSAVPTRVDLGEDRSSGGNETSTMLDNNMSSGMRASSSTTKRLIRNIKELLETGLLEGLKVKYVAGVREKFELNGRIHGGKILCSCNSCEGSKAISACEFEKHAGSLKKHPADYIFLKNGRTIRDVLEKCQAATVDTVETTILNAISLLPTIDNVCLRCKEPFHASHSQSSVSICGPCRDLSQSQAAQNSGFSYPHAKFLSEAGELFRREIDDLCSKSEENFAHGVSARSHAETNFQDHNHVQSNQNAETHESDIDHCEICRQDDFDASRCGPRTVLLCDECDREYHLGCLKDHGRINFEGVPKGKWFCTDRCKEVSLCFQRLIHQREMMLPNIAFSKAMMKNEEKRHLDIKWRLLSGRSTFTDNKLLLDSVISIFHESFNPIVGARGRDLIPLMTKGSKGQDHRYHGIYCAVLIIGSSVVSAVTLQILRCEVAQLPLIATSRQNQNKGYFQALFHCIQSFLVSLRIRHLLLPAAKEAEYMWIEKFGFIKRVPVECDREYHLGCLKDRGMINFEGVPKGKWFCMDRYKEVSLCVQRLIHQRETMLPDIAFSKVMMKNEERRHLDIKWRLLSGRSTFTDNKLLLDSVISIFHESFNPIVGARGRDLIPLMTKGSKGQDHRYHGIYCAVLIISSSVVSAVTLQILRCEVAQLPLIATSRQNHNKGYFQALFHCIQSFLVSLRIRHLLLPAAKEAEYMWIEKFGFIKRVPVENFMGIRRQNLVSQKFLHRFQSHFCL